MSPEEELRQLLEENPGIKTELRLSAVFVYVSSGFDL